MAKREFCAADSELQNVTDFVEEELDNLDCNMKAHIQLVVAVEEVFVNIAHYAYDGGQGNMTLAITSDDGYVYLEFADHGHPFDPLAKEDPDITLAAEERDVGGLGILMIKKTMDDVQYKYENKQNILILKKHL